jgi:hypothetical protein
MGSRFIAIKATYHEAVSIAKRALLEAHDAGPSRNHIVPPDPIAGSALLPVEDGHENAVAADLDVRDP